VNRRGFLGSILALAAAPAIVRADSLMRIVPTDTLVFESASIEFEIGPEPDFLAMPDNLSEIITNTIRARSALLAANITANNELLRYMKSRGVVTPFVGGYRVKLR
jgi:hypothetical protein